MQYPGLDFVLTHKHNAGAPANISGRGLILESKQINLGIFPLPVGEIPRFQHDSGLG